MFILCVVIEITQLIAKPMVAHFKDQDKIKSSDTSVDNTDAQYLSRKFIPAPISQWPSCQPSKAMKKKHKKNSHTGNDTSDGTSVFDDLPWYCSRPFSTIQETGRDLIALAVIPSEVSTWEECSTVEKKSLKQRISSIWKPRQGPSSPWYCKEPTTWVHSKYRMMADLLFDQFLVFVGIVCFVDVFVNFFTGEFEAETGVLVPKPFFVRWILPGLVLQLLVNPKMGTVAAVVADLMKKMFSQGPIRVFRWGIAVVFPVMYGLYHFVSTYIWMPVVSFENTYRTVSS
uniref:Uncharacterized protein n=1 Tax=Craspedostauros australis TaxID=1486917 RepID=A0A7R9WW97_9STRA